MLSRLAVILVLGIGTLFGYGVASGTLKRSSPQEKTSSDQGTRQLRHGARPDSARTSHSRGSPTGHSRAPSRTSRSRSRHRRTPRTCCSSWSTTPGSGTPRRSAARARRRTSRSWPTEGLHYNRFHVTALCSPTRAALLSGRNHHAVGLRLDRGVRRRLAGL